MPIETTEQRKAFIKYLLNGINALLGAQIHASKILTTNIRHYTHYKYAPNITNQERIEVTKKYKGIRYEMKQRRNLILKSINTLKLLATRLNRLSNLKLLPTTIQTTLDEISNIFDEEKAKYYK